ncbi:hypothetical protein M427DRAFT_71851 [Gonapodya prolifera JEL478]|uniref:Uncharacterized protein n=1 Tax=Gonapodya prolifera (strain JEL478) TaxID=1344416 RepID=A0A139A7G3_GONPJ|nr:hypothetical protein M427DRAFT_71851 [Gonapodya prolifera JEL478]|eukprot:KXS12732.1 hypothetical protein M427DRAFT_71851 [Gonapodya prolifera JEL478]
MVNVHALRVALLTFLVSTAHCATSNSNAAVLRPLDHSNFPSLPVYIFFNQSAVPDRGNGDVGGVVAVADPYDACGNDTRVAVAGSEAGGSTSTGMAVIVSPYNCTVATKLRSINRALAAASASSPATLSMLMVEFADSAIPLVRNESRAAVNGSADGVEVMKVPVVVVFEEDVATLRANGVGVKVAVHKYTSPNFDPSAIILILLALTTLLLGTVLSLPTHPLTYRAMDTVRAMFPQERSNRPRDEREEEEEEESAVVTWVAAIGFVVVAAGGLLLFFYFPGVVVYFVIAIFTLSSSLALAALFSLHLLPFLTSRLSFLRSLQLTRPAIVRNGELWATRGDLVGLALGAGVAAWWCVERKKGYIWVVQDVLGICFVANVIKAVGVPNLMVSTILLSLAFMYDAFFVFITPLFTSSGTSVMESVARGVGTSGESVPLLWVVPRLADELGGKAMLGFGDVVIPGLVVAMAGGWDGALRMVWKAVGGRRVEDGQRQGEAATSATSTAVPAPVERRPSGSSSAPSSTPSTNSVTALTGVASPSAPTASKVPRSWYLVLTSVAYVLALVICFVVVALTGKGQPALVYIVPLILGTIYAHAWWRGEVGALWRGEPGELWLGKAARREDGN